MSSINMISNIKLIMSAKSSKNSPGSKKSSSNPSDDDSLINDKLRIRRARTRSISVRFLNEKKEKSVKVLSEKEKQKIYAMANRYRQLVNYEKRRKSSNQNK